MVHLINIDGFKKLTAARPLLLMCCLLISTHLRGQNISALDSLEKMLPAAEGTQKAMVLYELVYGYLRTDISKAGEFVKAVKSISINERSPSARAYLKMAEGIYASRMGLLDSGIFYLNEAKQYASESHTDHALVRVYASLGHAYISSGKPAKGIENMLDGLHVLDRTPDKEMEMKLRTNIAWAYLELKQYRNCIDYGLANLKLMEGTRYEWIALYSYNNVAISYGALGLLDSASYFIAKGINAARKSNDIQSLANGYFILGTIYANAGKYDLAIAQYLKARPYREKVGNPLFIVSDLYSMSELYYKIGEYQKGVTVGSEALALAQKYKLALKFEGTYQSLARNYEGLGDFRNASKFYRLWALAKDSVYQNANSEAIAEMRTRFETEKKEQQLIVQKATMAEQKADLQLTYVVIGTLTLVLMLIILIFLLLRNRLRREREIFLREAQIHATIQSQENERRRFARDLHDGMGQLISALRLALHSIHRDSTLEDRVIIASKAENLLNEMHTEIRSIAFNLMPQTLVQTGLVPALKEMAARISDSSTMSVRVMSLDVPERMPELLEISLYRIVQEWINNVLKYAEATSLDVQLIGYEDEISVILEDNGNGFDTSILQQTKGNGWKNIRSRINLVKGTVEIDSQPSRKGTTVIMRIPFINSRHLSVAQVQPNTH